MNENLTIIQAAAYIGCKPATLRAWKAQARGPQYFRAGRLIRYRRTDLDEWILDQIAIPTPTISKPKDSDTAVSESGTSASTPASSIAAPSPRVTNPPYSSPADSRLALLRRRRALEQ